MNRHFIFDFETLGQDTSKCPVINCAFTTFDFDRLKSDNPYTFQELINDHIKILKLDAKWQVERLGYKVEKSTLEFWSSLPKDVQKQIQPKASDIDVEEFADRILDYLSNGNIKIWWTRGNTFDPIILNRLFRDIGRIHDIENVLKFWLVRDTRTYIDALTGFGLKKNAFNPLDEEDSKIFRLHDSVHDVAVDILRLQYLEQNV